ncbi:MULTISPECIES: hypothetical protein [Halorussus]|uniref:hypothetical protein n=1 Tax=Halorussus TaxID=1070314 RepID=UPI0020A10A9E|nr:hypothetical protein [Halorussus vallis]USZ77032.1 hypothetical protein NGM07_06815 [Halorussus vallis]
MSVTQRRSASVGDAPLPYARGALAGVSTWLLGYLVVYVWQADAVREALAGIGFVSRLLGGEAVPAWKGVAWLFLNAHFVATEIPTVAGGTRTENFVTAEGGGSILLLALAPFLLAIAGWLVARAGESPARDSRDGATAGATIVLGYLPLSAGVAFTVSHSIGNTEAAIAPDLVTAVLLAGAVYPLAFGALGGAVGASAD